MQHSVAYNFGFAALVCVVCSMLVLTAAVSLKDRQQLNAEAYRQRNVLRVAGLMKPDETLGVEEVQKRFDENIRVRIVDLQTGQYAANESELVKTYDQRQATQEPSMSAPAPDNKAGILRLPTFGTVYEVLGAQGVQRLIIPITGKGLWSTIYGFLALAADGKTIEGITFYEHGETPGLGGEIENPKWQALWEGVSAYDDKGDVIVTVTKGKTSDKNGIQGLSGATLTSRGVSNLVRFWLGQDGFGPYLENIRSGALSLNPASEAA